MAVFLTSADVIRRHSDVTGTLPILLYVAILLPLVSFSQAELYMKRIFAKAFVFCGFSNRLFTVKI